LTRRLAQRAQLAHWGIDFEDLLIDLLSRMICTASQRMFLDEV
jgi:hypothetical protein